MRVLVLVIILALLLPLLAALQYSWLGQLSKAEVSQMREILQIAANRFAQDFDAELASVYSGFQPEPAASPAGESIDYGNMYARWMSNSRFPRLIKDVWLVSVRNDSVANLKRLTTSSRQFEEASWPADMSVLRGQLESQFRRIHAWLDSPRSDRRTQMDVPMPPVFERPDTLLIPLFQQPNFARQGEISLRPPEGFVLLTLDLKCISAELLPELTRQHFPGESGTNIRITIVRRNEPKTVIFQTDPQQTPSREAGIQAKARGGADVTAGLFKIRFAGFPQPPLSRTAGASELSRGVSAAPDGRAAGRGQFADTNRIPGFGPMGADNQDIYREDGLWEIRIQHRAGSLEAAVSGARRRNLAISFSVLLLLGGSIIAIVISTRRARMLAQQQIEFVAAVSHELRTPITAIQTAGQSLADGVIQEKEQTRRYGELINRESRRLAGMIEQILEFAGGQSRYQRLDLRNVSIATLMDSVLSASQPLALEGGFQIESTIHPGLPDVRGDETSLRRVLQNLLDNAMKYSGTSRWIGLKARMHKGRKRDEVQISVRDRGIGISPDEHAHIFEPFFRGKAVTSTQIHGSGLGLSLVKGILEAHGGRITVESAPGCGSEFSIFLPVAASLNVDRKQDGNRPGEAED
jgi:signal transduction histidine kinase